MTSHFDRTANTFNNMNTKKLLTAPNRFLESLKHIYRSHKRRMYLFKGFRDLTSNMPTHKKIMFSYKCLSPMQCTLQQNLQGYCPISPEILKRVNKEKRSGEL